MFAGGGEKPPEVTDVSGQEDEEDAMVPGFSYGGVGGGFGSGFGSGFGIGNGGGGAGAGAGMNGSGQRWWGHEDASGANGPTTGAGTGGGTSSGATLPGLSDGLGFRAPPFGADDGMNSDDFIPGLGAAEHLGNTAPLPPLGPRGSALLPPQEDMWSDGGSGSGGRGDDWGSRGGPGGGRRGGGGYYDRRGGTRRGRY